MLEEVLGMLKEIDERDMDGELDYDGVMREVRGMITEVELMIEEGGE